MLDSLRDKDGKKFWKTWQSKFESKSKFELIDGSVDKAEMAEKFAKHFSSCSNSLRTEHVNDLKAEYDSNWFKYYGTPLVTENQFDIELVDCIISQLQRVKAAGLDSIIAEHIQYSHPPIVRSVLYKLFNIMITCECLPVSFGCGYTVPLIKGDAHGKSLTFNDFRGITISPVISKVFEHCILDRFSQFFVKSDNQFGFKRGLGCSHAIYSPKCG